MQTHVVADYVSCAVKAHTALPLHALLSLGKFT